MPRKDTEERKAYDRERYYRNREKKIAAAIENQRLNPERHRAATYAWNARNPEKKRVQSIVRRAVESGALVRQPCEVCGNEKVQAHHDDYTQPLDVKWLCAPHHARFHAEQRGNVDVQETAQVRFPKR